MQFVMLISNIRFVLHENQVFMSEIFECKGILMYHAKCFNIFIGNDYPNDKPDAVFDGL